MPLRNYSLIDSYLQKHYFTRYCLHIQMSKSGCYLLIAQSTPFCSEISYSLSFYLFLTFSFLWNNRTALDHSLIQYVAPQIFCPQPSFEIKRASWEKRDFFKVSSYNFVLLFTFHFSSFSCVPKGLFLETCWCDWHQRSSARSAVQSELHFIK